MSQPNGLPNECQPDTIGTHDFCDTSQWPDTDDSRWSLIPGASEAIKVTGVMMVFSQEMYYPKSGVGINSDFDFLVQLYITDRQGEYDVLAAEYPYYDMRDWFRRALKKTRHNWVAPGGCAVTDEVWQFDMDLSQEIVLWASSDWNSGSPALDAQNNPKLSKMIIKIRGDIPYRKTSDEQSDPAEIAAGKYFVERYVDPDV